MPKLSRGAVADSREDGGPPPVDRMHLKTGENFARKCTIFAQKFSGEGHSSLPRPHPLPFRLPVSNFWIRHCRGAFDATPIA